MLKKTINESLVTVLKSEGAPLTIKELLDRINEMGYYNFKSTNPAGVIANEIRRHLEGGEQSYNRKILYRKVQGDKYELVV